MSEEDRREESVSKELVRRIRDGDRDAEGALVERYSRGVRFLLAHLGARHDQVDDLYQETFRLVLEKVRAGELRKAESLSAFVRSIARNLFLAGIRKRSRHPTVSADEAPREEDGRAILPPDPTRDPLSHLLARESLSIVRSLIDALESTRDREILIRFFVAEHPKEAICEDLKLSSLHFNRVLYRARQRLKDALERFRIRQQTPGERV